MGSGEPSREQYDLITRLIRNEGAEVIHLPYTAAFDNLHSTFTQAASVELDKHEFWELMLFVRAGLRPADDRLPRVMGGPSSPTTPLPQESSQHSLPATSDFPMSLFPDSPETATASSSWTPAWEPQPKPEVVARRERLLAEIADSRLATIEQKVAFLLQRYPETRESDVALCIRYWERFQADVLEKWRPLKLGVLYDLDRVMTIVRSRQIIQNTLGLFRGLEETEQFRLLYQRELREFLGARQGAVPEVRFYLDETGNEGDKKYTGVAGVCVMNWQQYEMHAAALAQWRREQNWPETIHYSETGSDRIDRAVRLLAELQRRRSGLLFVGYALSARASAQEAMYTLFAQLVVDALRCLKASDSLQQVRFVQVIKEAQEGFDKVYLSKLNKHLEELIALEFPGQFAVKPIETLIKGQHVLLECADLIAGGMQRRAHFKGYKPKDRLAEAIVNVTGFENPKEEGALFRVYGGSGA
jgi:hypothetical protein